MDRARIAFLVKKLKNGQREYFSEFYTQTSPAAFYLAKKYCGVEAEDIVQDAYISFLSGIRKIDEYRNPLSYLFSVVRSKSIDYLRKRSRTDVFDHTQDADVPVLDDYDEGYPLLERCKKALSAEDFSLLELVIVYGYKQKEAAKILGKPLATVNYRYHRILSKVKSILKEGQNED